MAGSYLDEVVLLLIIMLLIVMVNILVKAFFNFSYFSKRNISHFGPIQSLRSFSSSLPLSLWEIHKKCGDKKMFGFFLLWRPIILIKDLDLIKQVLVKQFTSFYDRGVYVNEERDPLSGHLFAQEGEKWKKLRQQLSFAFSSGKIKLIFPIATKFGNQLVMYISKYPENESIECFNVVAKYTLSNISSYAFGIESDIFEDDSQFMKMSHKLNKPGFGTFLRTFLLFQLRDYAQLIPFKVYPSDITSFFINLTKDAVKTREESIYPREDFLQMLVKLKNKGTIDDDTANDDVKLTMNQLAAQTFVFILGGFETTAVAQGWALYELAVNPDIQRRLQAEIDCVSEWTFETINSLPYLDMVLSETLRMYPSVPFLTRRCNKDTVLEGSDVVINKGMDLSISVIGLHRDPALFPDPDKFDPERFGPDAKHIIQPYSYLPFGEGPRFCIGMRNGKIQFKIGIATLMKHFNVEPSEQTTIPPAFHPKAFFPLPKDGVYLKFSKRVV